MSQSFMNQKWILTVIQLVLGVFQHIENVIVSEDDADKWDENPWSCCKLIDYVHVLFNTVGLMIKENTKCAEVHGKYRDHNRLVTADLPIFGLFLHIRSKTYRRYILLKRLKDFQFFRFGSSAFLNFFFQVWLIYRLFARKYKSWLKFCFKI